MKDVVFQVSMCVGFSPGSIAIISCANTEGRSLTTQGRGFKSCSLVVWKVLERKKFIIKSIKRGVKTRPIYDCRCDERLNPKDAESTCLVYTGLIEELEYLKIETKLIDEKFASVMGECVI
jgi:hypothetical protein